ncbi:MAG: ATP-binding cassette domain-containing protein [Flavobacteriaceae bacterium]|nr:ATP-binding cassette domain-containing protein [Flavobacteriaceae bacterium]
MFTIHATNIEKRFGQQTLFSGFDYSFQSPESYALLGQNGSGKSTMLQLLYGYMLQGKGTIEWQLDGKIIEPDQVHQYIAFAAPYLELIEELTTVEMMDYHFKFKKRLLGNNVILEKVGLVNAADKPIKHFSSGMKQRLKLALAFFADTPALFLDEPCTNLDANGVAIYKSLIEIHGQGRLIVLASNDETEYGFCQHKILLSQKTTGLTFA